MFCKGFLPAAASSSTQIEEFGQKIFRPKSQEAWEIEHSLLLAQSLEMQVC
jgi:hypothetical protein